MGVGACERRGATRGQNARRQKARELRASARAPNPQAQAPRTSTAPAQRTKQATGARGRAARARAADTSGAVDLHIADRGEHHEVALQVFQVLRALVHVAGLLVLDDGQDELLVLVEDALHHVRRQPRLVRGCVLHRPSLAEQG